MLLSSYAFVSDLCLCALVLVLVLNALNLPQAFDLMPLFLVPLFLILLIYMSFVSDVLFFLCLYAFALVFNAFNCPQPMSRQNGC